MFFGWEFGVVWPVFSVFVVFIVLSKRIFDMIKMGFVQQSFGNLLSLPTKSNVVLAKKNSAIRYKIPNYIIFCKYLGIPEIEVHVDFKIPQKFHIPAELSKQS